MEKVYLCLIKRNKSDVKIVGTIVSSYHLQTSRLADVDILGLPAQERMDLKKIIEDHRMEWEPWIETALDYHQLMTNLHKRGINAPPSANAPLINFTTQVSKTVALKINKNRIMIRRMS
jgi:hypothetical protein